jgi:hypothetical protein
MCACGCGQEVKTRGAKLCRGHFTAELRQLWSEIRRRNNPMKNPEIAAKSAAAKRGRKNQALSETRRRMFADGTLTSPVMTEDFKRRASDRMKRQNPMHDPATRAKVSATRLELIQNYAEPTIAHYQKHGSACLVVMLPSRSAKRTPALASAMRTEVQKFVRSSKSAIWYFDALSQSVHVLPSLSSITSKPA